MNINTIEEEFIRDLESAITSPPISVKHGVWNPKMIAAPERHLANGAAEGILFGTQVFQLKRGNYPFELIETVLGTVYDLHKLFGKPVDPEKEQVWLFCYKWLSLYYTTITEENVMHSEFYRKHHTNFLELLGCGLTLVPERRKTFQELLEAWPYRLPPTTAQTASESFESDASEPPAAVVAVANVGPVAPPHRRLVLKRPTGHAERNKTRKGRYNSDHSLQTENLIRPVQDGT